MKEFSRGSLRGAVTPLLPTACLLASLTAPVALPTEATAGTRLFNGIVAVVDGKPITRRDLFAFHASEAPFLSQGEAPHQGELLEMMLEKRLLELEYAKNGIAVRDGDVERYVGAILARSRNTRDQLKLALAEKGVTWEQYFERMRHETARVAMMDIMIRARVQVSDEEVRRAWETSPEYLTDPKVEIAHLFLKLPAEASVAEVQSELARAAELAKQARRGRFEKVVAEHSDGPSAAEGGLLGAFTRESMASHFAEAIDGLKVGGVSDPVVGGGGIHIVKVLRNIGSERVPFEEVDREIAANIFNQRLDARFQRWVQEDLRDGHHVENRLQSMYAVAAEAGAQ